MAYARRASGLLLNRIIAGLDSCIQYDASKSAAITAVACGMQHMQCRWKRHSRFSRRENRPPPEMHIPEIEMPDMNTLKEDHPELYKLIAGHLSFAHATSDAAAVSAIEDLRARLTDRLRQLFPGRPQTHLIARSSLMKLKLAELRAECTTMGLSTEGFKEALVARLLSLLDSTPSTTDTSDTTSLSLPNAPTIQLPTLPDGAAPIDITELFHARVGAESEDEEGDILYAQTHMSPRQQKFGKMIIPKGKAIKPVGTWDGKTNVVEVVEGAQEAFAHVFTVNEVVDLLTQSRVGDIAVLDVSGKCNWADTMVVATCRSRRHVHATGAAVMHQVKQRVREVAPGVKSVLDGAADSEWAVVDAGSMVVHLMTAEQRKAVDLEGLWTAGEPHRVRRIVAGEGMPLTLDTITAEDV